MAACADDLRAGGPTAELLAHFDGHPQLDALCQRVLGAVQTLVLEGRAPELAPFHPFANGTPKWPDMAAAFVRVIAQNLDELRTALGRQVQTNEVRRCCGLLGGFLEIADRTRLPLDLLEIGSSAGFLLFFDHYRYQLGEHTWGGPEATLALETEWTGPAPKLDAPLQIGAREGCDLAPIDVTDPAQRNRIRGFYWADQGERLALLDGAIDAMREPAPLVTERAADFVERRMASPRPGHVTVLFHSVMWWYLPKSEQDRIAAAVERAGAAATPEAPIAWLRSEPIDLEAVEIRLRMWPGGEDQCLGRAHPHAAWVDWHGTAER